MNVHVRIAALALVLSVTLQPARAADPEPPTAEPLTADPLAAARAAIDRGDNEAAIGFATRAVDADPKNSRGYSFRAVLYEATKRFDKAVADYDAVIKLAPENVTAYQRRGECHFRLGRFKQSVADFDKVVELAPDRDAHHWQRGIALYYAGEFKRGAGQFERHKTVNPDDVENAAWHYLCVARESGAEKARQSLIPVSGDARVPMAQVQKLFAGEATADDVLAAANAGNPPPQQLRGRLFYAHLYIGLHQEAAGRADAAMEHILLAAEKYAGDDYMGDVARAHAALLKRP